MQKELLYKKIIIPTALAFFLIVCLVGVFREDPFFGTWLLIIAVLVLVIYLFVMILRWAFGIEKIIGLLKQIDDNTQTIREVRGQFTEANEALREIKIIAAKIEENTKPNP